MLACEYFYVEMLKYQIYLSAAKTVSHIWVFFFFFFLMICVLHLWRKKCCTKRGASKWKCRNHDRNYVQKCMSFNPVRTFAWCHSRTNMFRDIYLHTPIQYVKNALKNVLMLMWINVFLNLPNWISGCELTSERVPFCTLKADGRSSMCQSRDDTSCFDYWWEGRMILTESEWQNFKNMSGEPKNIIFFCSFLR